MFHPQSFFSFSPLENQWLEDEMDPVLSGWPIFRCKLLGLGRVPSSKLDLLGQYKGYIEGNPRSEKRDFAKGRNGSVPRRMGKKTTYKQDS